MSHPLASTGNKHMIIIYDRRGLCELARIDADSLRNADLRGNNLENANLVQMDLSGSDLRGANLCDALLDGANTDNARGYRPALPVSMEPSNTKQTR